MSPNPYNTGTTLETLAAHAAYGLEVQHMPSGERGVVTGLDFTGIHHHPVMTTMSCQIYSPDELLPVLRPFSALDKALEQEEVQGVIPALELAKIAVPEVSCVRAEILDMGFGNIICYCLGAEGQRYYGIHRKDFQQLRLPGSLCDKLREMGFAVGLEAVEFITKAD